MNPNLLPIIDLLAKSTALLLFAWAVQSLWRRASAMQRCLVWLITFAVLLPLPLTLLLKPLWTVAVRDGPPPPPPVPITRLFVSDTTWMPLPDRVPLAAPAPVIVKPTWFEETFPDKPAVFMAAAFFLWLGVALLLIARRLLGTLQLIRLRHRSSLCESESTRSLFRRLCSELGIRRAVDLRESGEVSVPMTWGVLHPVLLLPAEAAQWSDGDLEAALRHELGHIRHGDAFTRFLMSIACALQWPNPLVWLAARSWRLHQEQSCDDLVVRSGVSRESYALQLLNAAASVQRSGLWRACALTMAQPSTLETRLSAIMDESRRRVPLSRVAWLAGTAVACLLLSLSGALQLRAAPPPEPERPTSGPVDKLVLRANSAEDEPEQLLFRTKIIEAKDGANLDVFTKSLGKKGESVILSDKEFQEKIREVSQQRGIDLLSSPSVTTRPGLKAEISVGPEAALHSPVPALKLEVTGTLTPGGIEVKASVLLSDRETGFFETKRDVRERKPGMRERKVETTQTLRSGETLLLVDPTHPEAGKPRDVIFLITVERLAPERPEPGVRKAKEAAAKPPLNPKMDLQALNTSFDPQTNMAKGSGDAKVTINFPDDPSMIWKAKSDSFEYDSNAKILMVRGHPEVSDGHTKHSSAANDAEMILDMSGPEVKLSIHGESKTEILSDPNPPGENKGQATAQPPAKSVSLDPHVAVTADVNAMDSSTMIYTGTGHAQMTITTTDTPPVVWVGTGDQLVIDCTKKISTFTGHPQVAKASDWIKRGTADDTKIVLDWSDPREVKMSTYGSSKTEILSHSNPDAAKKESAAAAAPAQAAPVRVITMQDLDDRIELKTGDTVDMRIVEDHDKAIALVVGDSGEIQAPYLGLVHAAGLTAKKLAYLISDRLEKEGHFKKGTVIVALDGGPYSIPPPVGTGSYFTVFGQVQRQGKYEFGPGDELTVSQALLRAGGPTELAKTSKVHVVRKTPEGNKTINVNCDDIMKHGMKEKDIFIRPNDVIIVDEKVFASSAADPNAPAAGAAPPLEIKSSGTSRYDSNTGVATFTGGVTTVAGGVQMRSDTLVVKTPPAASDDAAPNASSLTDEEFIRRVYLEITGQPPTAEVVRAFTEDKRDTKTKREELIQKLTAGAAKSTGHGKPETIATAGTLVFTNTDATPTHGGTLSVNGGTLVLDSNTPSTTNNRSVTIVPIMTVDDKGNTVIDPLAVTNPAGPKANETVAFDAVNMPTPASAKPIPTMDQLDDTVTLQVGDEVSYRILEDAQPVTTTVRVLPSGEVDGPNIGVLPAAGLTCKKLAFAIKQKLEKHQPKATVLAELAYRPGKTSAVTTGNKSALTVTRKSAAETKAEQIILPTLKFRESLVDECVDFLRIKARELDPAKQGVNIIIKADPASLTNARITLDLNNVPLMEALRYVAGLANLELSVGENALILHPVGAKINGFAPREVAEFDAFVNYGKPIQTAATDAHGNPTTLNLAGEILTPEGGKLVIGTPAPAAQPARSPALLQAEEMVLPSVRFAGATPEEAMEFLRANVKALTPAGAPVLNLVLKPDPNVKPQPKLTLDLKQVPLAAALSQVAELSHLQLCVMGNTFILEPRGTQHDIKHSNLTPPEPAPANLLAKAAAQVQAEEIIIPLVTLQGATLTECLDFLRAKSKPLQKPGDPPVNIFVKADPGGPLSKVQITLDLHEVPLMEVLRYVAELANLELSATENALILHARDMKLEGAVNTSGADLTVSGGTLTLAGNVTGALNISDATLAGNNTLNVTGGQVSTTNGLIFTATSQLAEAVVAKSAVELKAEKLILPKVALDGASIDKCVATLNGLAKAADPQGKGVTIIVDDAFAGEITLNLTQVPLSEALRYVSELANMQISVNGDTFVLHARKANQNGGDGNGEPAPPAPAAPSQPMPKADPAKRARAAAQTKADQIILPKVKFNQATLAECLEFLRIEGRDLDPAKEGVNIFVKADQALMSKPGITLDLTHVSLADALRYVAELSGLQCGANNNALLIYPEKPASGDVSRSYGDTGLKGVVTPDPKQPAAQMPLEARAQTIVIPSVQFNGATVTEALEFLRVQVQRLGAPGVNMILKPNPGAGPLLNMDLKSVPLTEVLRYIAALSDLQLSVKGDAFVLEPATGAPR